MIFNSACTLPVANWRYNVCTMFVFVAGGLQAPERQLWCERHAGLPAVPGRVCYVSQHNSTRAFWSEARSLTHPALRCFTSPFTIAPPFVAQLDVLACNDTGGTVEGNILINGERRQMRSFQRNAGYVLQVRSGMRLDRFSLCVGRGVARAALGVSQLATSPGVSFACRETCSWRVPL